MTVTIMKKKKKTWVGIFQVGISRGEFDGWEFSGREFSWYLKKRENPAFEKTEFMRNILFSIHLYIQIRMQTFLEISQNFYND